MFPKYCYKSEAVVKTLFWEILQHLQENICDKVPFGAKLRISDLQLLTFTFILLAIIKNNFLIFYNNIMDKLSLYV